MHLPHLIICLCSYNVTSTLVQAIQCVLYSMYSTVPLPPPRPRPRRPQPQARLNLFYLNHNLQPPPYHHPHQNYLAEVNCSKRNHTKLPYTSCYTIPYHTQPRRALSSPRICMYSSRDKRSKVSVTIGCCLFACFPPPHHCPRQAASLASQPSPVKVQPYPASPALWSALFLQRTNE